MTLHPLNISTDKTRGMLWQAGVVLAALLCAAVLVRVGSKQPLYVVAALYVGAFMTLAWRRPAWALLFIFAVTPLQTDVSNGGFAKFSMAEVNLALTFPLLIIRLLIKKRLPSIGPLIFPVLLYLGICVYSSWLTFRGEDAIISIVQMVLYFVIAVAVFASYADKLEDMRTALYALVVVAVVLTGVALATSYTFMGMNKNGIGSSLACATLVGAELWLSETSPIRRRRLMLAMGVIAIGLLISLSRGAWLGTALGLITIFGMHRQWGRLAKIFAVVIPMMGVLYFLLPQDTRDYATGFGRDHYNINARYESVDIAKKYYEHNPIVGEGVGIRKEYDATNIAWMVLAETGAIGLVSFMLIHLVFFGLVRSAQRRMHPSQPTFTFLTIGAALILNQLSHGMVDHYWSRGALMTAWAAAGMAIGVYLAQRRLEVLR